MKHPSHALLVLRGSESAFGPEEWENLTETATRAGIVAAVLDQVPNGTALARYRGEDEYIAHTFRQFLATGDESWPLLLPMVKSVQRAMDCLQAVSKEKLGQKIEKFIILGNGPRGWCAWLAGALDPRVSGIVPSGFTGVNFPKIVGRGRGTRRPVPTPTRARRPQ